MFQNMMRRMIRQPLTSLAVLLFAAGLTVVLCHLHSTGREELRSYEETYASVPVYFKVVDLDGSKPGGSTGIDGLVKHLFEDDWPKPVLKPYMGEIHYRTSLSGKYYLTDENGAPILNGRDQQQSRSQTTVGVTSTRVAEELTESWGGKIYWNEGYDESILSQKEFVCIVPESMRSYRQLDMEFTYEYWPTGIVNDFGEPILMEFRETFQVVGYYTDPGNNNIYCPYLTMASVNALLHKQIVIEEIGAVLADNSQLAQFKEDAYQWFAEPNPLGEKTPWGKYGWEYYLYALDIDDTMLTNLETNMKNSLRLNQLASAVIFAMSAGAGFLTGFLVIRSRKREIALMRTLGTSNPRVCLELGIEQILCVAAGIILGGGYSRWEPFGKLGIFAGIYIAGLTAALLIFIRANLLATIKEDE